MITQILFFSFYVTERHEAALALYGDYMHEIITSSELADPVKGLRKAIKPVWITKEDVKGTLQRYII